MRVARNPKPMKQETAALSSPARADHPGPSLPAPSQGSPSDDGLRASARPSDGTAPGLESCCPFQEAIDLLSRRHAMTIIWLLQQQSPRRFNDIRRGIDVNPVTLTQRLEELEQCGVVSRKAFKQIPPRVEYSLTQKGADLIPLMDQLSAWSRKHGDEPA